MTAKSPTRSAAKAAKVSWLDVLDTTAPDLTEVAKAELLGVSVATLWRYRQGIYQPRLDKAVEIAALLGIPVEQVAA